MPIFIRSSITLWHHASSGRLASLDPRLIPSFRRRDGRRLRPWDSDRRWAAVPADGGVRGRAALPERAVGPTLLEGVVIAQGAAVGGELPLHESPITPQPGGIAPAQPIRDRVGGEDAGAQSLDDALRGDRVEARGRVAHGDQRL